MQASEEHPCPSTFSRQPVGSGIPSNGNTTSTPSVSMIVVATRLYQFCRHGWLQPLAGINTTRAPTAVAGFASLPRHKHQVVSRD